MQKMQEEINSFQSESQDLNQILVDKLSSTGIEVKDLEDKSAQKKIEKIFEVQEELEKKVKQAEFDKIKNQELEARMEQKEKELLVFEQKM